MAFGVIYLLVRDLRAPYNSFSYLPKVFGIDLVQALYYLHTHGLLFCDLKPSNILLNEFGVLKLSDFALAKKTLSYNEGMINYYYAHFSKLRRRLNPILI